MEPEEYFALRYHGSTNHTPFSVRTSGHFLDWSNQPLPFKIYEDIEPIALAPHLRPVETPMLDALAGQECEAVHAFDVSDLARILYYSAGVVRTRELPRGGVMCFRAAACTGALYQIDLYVACGELEEGIGAGLYHFSPHDFGLRCLRQGDCRGAVATALGGTVHAEAYVVSGATYWRNAWKYQARAYRHFGWDDGTILANLLATASAIKQPARVHCAFADQSLNHLLGLDPQKEVAYSIVSVGVSSAPHPPSDALSLPALAWRTRPLSRAEVDYPLMREMHAVSTLSNAEDVRRWTSAPEAVRADDTGVPGGPPQAAVPLPSNAASNRSFHDVISRRGSTRQFDRVAIKSDELATILRACMAPVAADFPRICDAYLIVNDVQEVLSGAYMYREDSLRLLKSGLFRTEAAFLDLEQPLAGDASVNVYFMAELHHVMQQFGNRGYRAAQLEAGIRGGRIYLAAYALGLGATGLTFFDEDVARFFPTPTPKDPIFLVAAGRSARRA